MSATIVTFADRDAWLEARRKGIGGSDCAAILGYNPHRSPYNVWLEKTGRLPPEDLAERVEAVRWGLRLEAPIVDGFGADTGREVRLAPPYQIHRPQGIDWLFSTLDAVQYDRPNRGDEPGDLQVKTGSEWVRGDWAFGQTPLAYLIQVQTELYASGFSWGSIAVLLGGQRLEYRDLDRDQDFIDAMLPRLERFWKMVTSDTPPAVDGSETTRRVLKLMHPTDNGLTVELPDDATGWADGRADAKQREKDAKAEIDLYDNSLRAAIGDATFGQLPDGRTFSLKTSEVKEYVVPARTQRTLREVK